MNTLIALLLAMVTVAGTQLLAQSPPVRFYNLTTEDGLSGDVAHCIGQDKNGFIWIGTQRGLDRFDGYNFRRFEYDPHNANSIWGNQVYKMQTDKNGIIWFVTNKGLNNINPVNEKLAHFPLAADKAPMSMSDLFFANDTVLLINANTALFWFNTATKKFTEIKMPAYNYSLSIFSRCFAKNKQGEVFISNGEDLLHIDWLQNVATVYKPQNITSLPASFKITNQVYFDAAGNTWCFGKNDAAVVSNTTAQAIQYPYKSNAANAPENIITGFLEEPGKRLWISTGAGLVLYDYVNKRFSRYRKQPGNEASLSNNRITGIIKDNHGLYWMGTYGNGICSLNKDVQFDNILLNASPAEESFIIYKFVQLPFNKVLVHTLARRDFIIDAQHHVENAATNKEAFPLDATVKLATGSNFLSFSEYDKQLLCSLYAAKKYKTKQGYYVTAASIGNAKPLFTDAANKLWMLDGNRLFDGSTYVPTNVDEYISYAVETKGHEILMATGAGLFVFGLETMKLKKTYLHDEKEPYSISSDYIKYLLPDASGNCWIATADAGLNYLDAATNRFHHYTIKDGLPDNSIYMIVPDNKGRLWLSTNKGLSCFDTLSKTFTNYDRSNGLINNEYNSLSAWTGSNGRLYFAGMKGIDHFNPDDFDAVKNKPQLYLSLFKVFDSILPIRSYYQLQTNDNNISIQFSTNDFLHASKIFYKWKLAGVDEDWIIKKGENSALYNKLPPGSYVFTVQASYNNKQWSEPVVTKFKIATPWYQTWWFFGVLAAVIIVAITIMVRYRLQQQMKMFMLRNRIQRDLHDDIGATLSSIKAYTEIIKTNPGNTIIADLINNNASEMIERLEVIIWAANPMHDNLEHFTNRINRFAAPLLHSKRTRLSITADGVSKTLVMPGEVRQHLFLVIKEAVNNVAKYAEATSCTISVTIQRDKFLVKIEDDGCGFDTNEKPKGNGLNNMRSRTAQLAGSIEINSTPGKGTTITVSLQYPFKTVYKPAT